MSSSITFRGYIIAISLVLLTTVAYARPVSPFVHPHVTFVDQAGDPCSGCSLYTYAAGTSTPLATFVDSTGVSQNTNPIILDAAGGASIWLGSASYKIVLKDAQGSTIWTSDNVNASTGFPCSTSNTIQLANAAANGLTCDPNIIVNPSAHTLSIGTLPTSHVTIGALGTPTSWQFDTTSPATARASIGAGLVDAGTAGQIVIYAASGTEVQGSSAIPGGITATTASPGDNSTKIASTAYVALPGPIAPSSLVVASGTPLTDNQGAGAKLQHATGAYLAGHCVQYDPTGNTTDAGGPCVTSTTVATCATLGCYRIDGDGTITQWGTATGCGSGSTCSTSITFPHAFTSTTNLTVQTTLSAGQATWYTNATTISVSGFSLGFAAGVVNGGSGNALDGSEAATWFAIGK